MNITIQSIFRFKRKCYWTLIIVFFFLYFLKFTTANSSQVYYEGKEAESIIKSGELQEKITEEDHTHLIIEYQGNVFWCTIEKNDNKICNEY